MSTSGENDIFFTDEATAEGVGIRGGFLCLKARGKGCRGIKVGGIVLDESERHVGEGKRVRSLDTGSPILQCSNQAPGRGGSATILHRVSADGEIFFQRLQPTLELGAGSAKSKNLQSSSREKRWNWVE